MLNKYEVPIAYSIVKMLRQMLRQEMRQAHEPAISFMLKWVAFNNIYTALADQNGQTCQLNFLENGDVKTKIVEGFTMPSIKDVKEKEQINIACQQADERLKRDLIMHDSTKFFVYRSPMYQGQKIEGDRFGQRVNGVLNVSRTVSFDYPTWSPVDTNLYEEYRRQSSTGQTNDIQIQDKLARQIFDLLYTVRNNTFHGGKRMDNANDKEVLEKAIPLLSLIIAHFLPDMSE